MLCTSGFTDDATFSYHESKGRIGTALHGYSRLAVLVGVQWLLRPTGSLA